MHLDGFSRTVRQTAVSCEGTLQHAVVGLPVLLAQRLPETGWLRPLVTLQDADVAAAVEPRLQRTPGRSQTLCCHLL